MTPHNPGTLVFDTGPLLHFSRQGWLGVLHLVVGERIAVVPETVTAELTEAAALGHTHARLVLEARWITHSRIESAEEIRHFAVFSASLAGNGRNTGEVGVLALAKSIRATAVLDDRAARRTAQQHKVKCQGTLGLLCEAVRSGQLTIGLVSWIADRLLEGEYRLPFAPGGFERWARENLEL